MRFGTPPVTPKFIHAWLGAASVIAFMSHSHSAFAMQADGKAAVPQSAEIEPATSTAAEAEIVVTARLRSDRQLDVPVAITAIGGEELLRSGANDLTRIGNLVPSVVIAKNSSGSGGLISLRGVASSPSNSAFESSVGINLDGITITRGYITRAEFFDLEQVEVLKGPQALFFGKNSPAGVISMRSVGPGAQWEGYARGGYELIARERILEGAFGGPIGGGFGARLAVRYSQMDGYFVNRARALANPFDPSMPLPGAVGNTRTPEASNLTGRLTLAYESAAGDFDATIKLLYVKFHDNELTAQQQVIGCAPGRTSGTTLGFQDPYGDCKADRYRSSGFYSALATDKYPYLTERAGPFTENRIWLPSLQLNYDADWIKLTSLTGYFDLSAVGFSNVSFDSFARFGGINGEKNRIFSQELRFLTNLDGIVNFAGGAFYEHSWRNPFALSRSVSVFGPDPRNDWDPQVWASPTAKTDTKSGFLQAILKPIPEIELTAGARYTQIDQHVELVNLFVNQYRLPGAQNIVSAQFRPESDALSGEYSDNNLSPEFTISYKPSRNQTLYAAYKTGYKTGGISTTIVILRSDTIPNLTFQSEKARGGEIGYKTEMVGGNFKFDINAYYYKYSELQRTTLDLATTSFLVRNAASATVKGVEVDTSYRFTDAFRLRLAANFNDARYDNFPGGACYNGQAVSEGCVAPPGSSVRAQDLSGQRLSRAPRVTFNAGVLHTSPISSALNLELGADVRYSSRYFLSDDNDPNAVQPKFAKVDLTARVFGDMNRWEITLAARNITNKYISFFGGAKPGGAVGDIFATVDRGREFAVGGTYRF